ncbi:MAG: carbohydrate ABC transporter permease [Alphaproteobacteria bacterium]|nr:carbohydrate ABC transporter permease [Alphaproteobacteria bacterium]
MIKSITRGFIRDVTAWTVTGLFMAPFLWWALTSIKPNSAIFDKDRSVFFDFVATLDNYKIILGGHGPDALSARQAFIDSTLIALLVTTGLFDTRIGVALMHTVFTLPVATLMLMSFFDDLPKELDEASRLDGATVFQFITRIAVPMIRGGVAATGILCFIFSWTEFLMSLFLSVSFRTLPVLLSILAMGMWGPLAALGTAAMLPGFAFILAMQKHLIRGLAMGLHK